MKNKTLILLLITTILFSFLTSNAQQTKVITADKNNEYGLVYSLPVTALGIKVSARKQTFRAGKYYQYAKKYLGTDRVVKENSDKWEIMDVEVSPYGMADNENQYLMQLKPGTVTFIGVAEDGMLLSINARPDREAVNLPNFSIVEEMSLPNPEEYLKYVDEDFLASQSIAKQAEILAENLMNIRQSIRDISNGTADPMPADGTQMELMLQSLRSQEDALARAFTGCSSVTKATKTFSFLPQESDKYVLFRLSDFAGFVESDDYSGDPVYIEVNVTREGKLPIDINGDEKKFPKDGVAYTIPGSAEITISFNGKRLWNKELEFAQFGTTFGLDPKLFTSKKDPSFAKFSSVTGGLLELGISTEN